MKVSELLKIVDGIVPLENAFEDDLVGITIGSEENEVNGIVVAHELDKQLLDYCLDLNINTVITYHPPSFNKILGDDNIESFHPEPTTLEFIDNSMNVITLHTAQDVCVGGNADTLAELFNLKNIKLFAMTNDKYGAGRIGDIDGILVSKFNELVESILNTKSAAPALAWSLIKLSSTTASVREGDAGKETSSLESNRSSSAEISFIASTSSAA